MAQDLFAWSDFQGISFSEHIRISQVLSIEKALNGLTYAIHCLWSPLRQKSSLKPYSIYFICVCEFYFFLTVSYSFENDMKHECKDNEIRKDDNGEKWNSMEKPPHKK